MVPLFVNLLTKSPVPLSQVPHVGFINGFLKMSMNFSDAIRGLYAR